MHLAMAANFAPLVPIPGGLIWVYITGIGLIAATVSIIIGKYDKLAATLLGLMLLIFVLSVHLPGVMEGGEAQMKSMPNFLKDLALAGAAWMYAGGAVAKDASVVG
ncbi:MAG: hypothetical protein DHS20C18_11560 [Saprospiraceae bacterium]|nr:MAG: hypothetical protein DHS20C18_11560 [Saprospiraceae bacterium]